jgi:hypothetical protein
MHADDYYYASYKYIASSNAKFQVHKSGRKYSRERTCYECRV